MKKDLAKYIWIVLLIAFLAKVYPSLKARFNNSNANFAWESLSGVSFPDFSNDFSAFSYFLDVAQNKKQWEEEKIKPVLDEEDRYKKESLAVVYHDVNYLQKILKPEDVKVFDKNGRNLLLWAVVNNSEKCVDFLVEKGSDVDFKDKTGKFPLDYAVTMGNISVAGKIGKKMKNVVYSRYEFYLAPLLADDLDYLDEKLNEGNVDTRFGDGTTLLHWAAGTGNVEAIKLLLKKKAMVDSFSKRNETPLYIACYYGKPEAVKLLLSSGAKTYYADKQGNTPLHVAANKGYLSIVKLLVDAGADLNEKNEYGITPLDLAVNKNHKDVIDFLIKKGAKSNILKSLKKKDKNDDVVLNELEKSPEWKKIMETVEKLPN